MEEPDEDKDANDEERGRSIAGGGGIEEHKEENWERLRRG